MKDQSYPIIKSIMKTFIFLQIFIFSIILVYCIKVEHYQMQGPYYDKMFCLLEHSTLPYVKVCDL